MKLKKEERGVGGKKRRRGRQEKERRETENKINKGDFLVAQIEHQNIKVCVYNIFLYKEQCTYMLTYKTTTLAYYRIVVRIKTIPWQKLCQF